MGRVCIFYDRISDIIVSIADIFHFFSVDIFLKKRKINILAQDLLRSSRSLKRHKKSED